MTNPISSKCPAGMVEVPAGRRSYTAYSFPGDLARPVKKQVTKHVDAFCVTPLVSLQDMVNYWRLKGRSLGWLPKSVWVVFDWNKGRKINLPVLGVSAVDAKKYCQDKYFSHEADLPSEKQWEHARQTGNIQIQRSNHLELLSTTTSSTKGTLNLAAGLYSATGPVQVKRSATKPTTNWDVAVFRCIAPEK